MSSEERERARSEAIEKAERMIGWDAALFNGALTIGFDAGYDAGYLKGQSEYNCPHCGDDCDLYDYHQKHMIIAHDEKTGDYTVRLAEGRTDILGRGKTAEDAVENLKSKFEDEDDEQP